MAKSCRRRFQSRCLRASARADKIPESAIPDCSETLTASCNWDNCSPETFSPKFKTDLFWASVEEAFGDSPAERPITTASKNAPGSASRGFALSSIRSEITRAMINKINPMPTAIAPRDVSKAEEIVGSPSNSAKITASKGSIKIRFALALGEAKATFSSADCLCCESNTWAKRSKARARLPPESRDTSQMNWNCFF